MTFKKLAEYFQKLEGTSSRNSMVEILARLFGEANGAEIGKIAYLLQGRVAPLFEPVEFGMADKMVIKAMAKAYGASGEEITRLFKKTGDLGAVAESLGKRSRQELTVVQVFEKLTEITQATGTGSVEKKVDLLANLLRDSDPLSAKYIARTPVDKLRLGFSDMTMLEGLSWMIDGTKKHKPTIEAAYNIRPDLGFIASSVKRKGVSGVRDVRPAVGTPILVMRAERLTSAEEILEKTGGKAAVEPKLDGFRLQLHYKRSGIAGSSNFSLAAALAGTQVPAAYPAKLQNSTTPSIRQNKVRLFSRGLELVTTMYPDVVEAALKEIKADEVILDGEAIGFNIETGKYLPFQETAQRKRKYDVDLFSKNIPLKLVVFDCLYLDGKSLIAEPYEKRRQVLETLIKKSSLEKKTSFQTTIVPAEMKIVEKADDLEKVFQETISWGLEGIMVKKLDGVYQAGARGWNWIKLKGSYTGKLNDTVDAVVMGLDYGQGKRNKFGVGAFLIGIYDQKNDSFKTVSKVGTGLTDQEWRDLKTQSAKLKADKKPGNYDVNKIMDCDVWLRPKLVGEFRADELTKSPMHTVGYALRFPRLVQWREKKPEDATSLKEIEEMVRIQDKS